MSVEVWVTLARETRDSYSNPTYVNRRLSRECKQGTTYLILVNSFFTGSPLGTLTGEGWFYHLVFVM